MEKIETTPAPWHAAYDEGGYWVIIESNRENVFDNDCVDPEIAEANAKLAASAPILKELVEKQDALMELFRQTHYKIKDAAKLNKEIEQLKSQL